VLAVVDSDGATYAEASTDAPERLKLAMSDALELWQDREIVWNPSISGSRAAARERSRLMLLAFTDNGKESKEALKALESRVVAKYHDSLQFVEQALDSETAKLFGVTEAATFLVVHPDRVENGKELGRTVGTTLEKLKPMIKSALQKARQEKEKD
jgi:hypothetical protein